MAKGQFPRRVKIGVRAVGWLESEVTAWLESRVAASRTAA
nr:D478 [uncultured bacterium]